MSLPADLVPLPTAPYLERPETMPLEVEECRTALWLARGNISKAAEILKVPSSRLRRFVRNSAYLTEEWHESREVLADKAQEIVEEALFDEDDAPRRDAMARFVLQTIAKNRGFSTSGAGVSVNVQKGGKVQIAWGDGTAIGPNKPESAVIEGEVTSDA